MTNEDIRAFQACIRKLRNSAVHIGHSCTLAKEVQAVCDIAEHFASLVKSQKNA